MFTNILGNKFSNRDSAKQPAKLVLTSETRVFANRFNVADCARMRDLLL